MRLFKFVVPAHLRPPPAPHFRFLSSTLEMRVLIRMGFEETKRVQMGWFREEHEVQKVPPHPPAFTGCLHRVFTWASRLQLPGC